MALKRHDEITAAAPQASDLDLYSDEELLELRMRIDEKLGIGHLGSLDVGAELMIQLRTLKLLQHQALTDKEAPLNQKAQATNTVSALLRDLVKSRARLYDAERSKAIEDMTIDALKDCPMEVKDQFFARLEKMLATLPTLASLMDEAQT